MLGASNNQIVRESRQDEGDLVEELDQVHQLLVI